MSDTTPWWERPDTQVKQDHLTEGEGDGCSNATSTTVRTQAQTFSPRNQRGAYRTSPKLILTNSLSHQHSCKTAPDENDVMRRKCERITRKFRQCPGRCVESDPLV